MERNCKRCGKSIIDGSLCIACMDEAATKRIDDHKRKLNIERRVRRRLEHDNEEVS